jgi:hypothetical protein
MTASTLDIAIDDRRTTDSRAAAARLLVRAEYEEMPGLSLTPIQAARMWGLTRLQSERLLDSLATDGFLVRDRRGAYRRGPCPRCA